MKFFKTFNLYKGVHLPKSQNVACVLLYEHHRYARIRQTFLVYAQFSDSQAQAITIKSERACASIFARK